MTYLLAIDGSYTVHRSMNQGRMAGLCRKDGAPTGGTYGALATIMKAVRTFRPRFVAAAFDGGLSPRRTALYPGYKKKEHKERFVQTRTAKGRNVTTPFRDSYKQQTAWLKELLMNMGVSVIDHMPEADDSIYFLTRKASRKRRKSVILTADKDFLQLLSKYVSIYWPVAVEKYGAATRNAAERRIVGCIHTRESFCVDFGFQAENYPFYHAMVGDPSDMIKGVRGIGPKWATAILSAYDQRVDLETLLDANKKLQGQADVLQMNLQLVDLSLEKPKKETRRQINFAMGKRDINVRALRKLARDLAFSDLSSDPEAVLSRLWQHRSA